MKDQIQAQRARLRRAQELLKSEFIGLDSIIDSLIDGVTAWACMPEAQQRPTIIGLWGLTGVGKSSLIKRLAHHMDWTSRLSILDSGEMKVSSSLSTRLSQLAEDGKLDAPIFLLDEFQRGFTVEEGKEVYGEGLLWDWLDTGKMTDTSHIHNLAYAFQEVRKLRQCVEMGVGVEKGRVVSEEKLYQSIMEDRDYDLLGDLLIGEGRERKERKPFFVKFRTLEFIADQNPRKWSTAFTLYQALCSCPDGVSMVDLLEDEIRELLAPRVYDTHNALVFVAGNLDDAYGMAFDVEVDSDADVMKSQSQAIGLPEIKSALLRRYRPEQIARLGNRHLIYPAFGRKEYEEIIARTAQEVLSRYGASYGFELEASPSLLSIVYQEGVAPAQGVRPVLSTVDQLVTSRLPAIYLAACELDEAVDRVVLEGCTTGIMETKFYRGGRLLGQTSDRVVLLNQKARDQKTPATRAVISVHEAGHALVQLLRTGVFPTRLTSVTANRSLLGYSATRRESGVKVRTAQDEFVNMEVLFGGLVAEEVLFGKQQATAGSGDDILQATRSAGLMIKKRGQGSVYYHGDHQASECEWSVKAEDAKLDREVADTLTNAHESARQLLEEHKSTLVALSHELYLRETLTEEDLRAYWVQELGLALPEVQAQDFDTVLEAAFQQHHGLRRVG